MRRQLLLFSGLFLISFASLGQIQKARQYYGNGYYMINQRNYSVAIDNFLKAIETDSTGDCGTGTKGKAHGELAYAYLLSGDTIDAAIYFDKAILLDPTNPSPRQNKAVMLSMQKKFNEAYQELEELIQLNPNHIEAYIQRGFLYEANDKIDLAILDFEKALKLNSKSNILPPDIINDIKMIIKTKRRR
jgi:tetratricopeptide (TPR) repeat protein